MRITRTIHYSAGLFLAAAVIAVTAPGGVPAGVKAAPGDPVDLELDSAGYTAIVYNNARPGDSGTKTVELRNAGTGDGYVSIWLSDIVSDEGLNPESETGDTTGSGELDAHFTLDIEVDGLNTNMDLPAAVRDMPKGETSVEYIEIIPLKAGETVTLDWHWELPADTGNEVQGDELSFTINYVLWETEITDVSGDINPGGDFARDVTIFSKNRKGKVVITANTTGKTTENQTPGSIWLIELPNEPPAPAAGEKIVGYYYEAGPDGMVFDKPLTLTLSYRQEELPQGVSEDELYIAFRDKELSRWVALPNCVADPGANTVTTTTTHFSRYTIISPEPPPAPTVYIPPAAPDEPVTEDKEEEKNLLEVNLLDEESVVETGEDGRLEDAVILGDPDGDFFIKLEAGTKVTGTGGIPLSRLELEIVEKYIALPDDTVALSPVYRLTGYAADGRETGVLFDPAAVLTLKYNAGDIPENSYLPFLIRYSDQDGITYLTIPYGAVIEPGEAQAFIDSDGYFLVVTEVAPPPPPLPASFVASDLLISPSEVLEGNPVRISVTITNEGALSGSHELYLVIDGIVRATQEVTLGSKSSETLTFELSNLGAGSHQVKIAGLTGTIRVTLPPTEPLTAGVNWLALDLGVGAAVIAGLIAWFFFMRRTRRRAVLK